MYCIRLIKKKIKENEDYDVFVSATHIRILENKLYLLDPISKSDEDVYFDIKDLSFVFINHYQIYIIDDVVSAYKKIVDAYSVLSNSQTIFKEYDNTVSIFELMETMFSSKESAIIEKVFETSRVINKNQENSKSENSDELELNKNEKIPKEKHNA